MDLSDLEAYAEEKYGMTPVRRPGFPPGVTELCLPGTTRNTAVLIRQWDGDLGEFRESCDIRCGAVFAFLDDRLTRPFFMRGRDWVGVPLNASTDAKLVYRLLDEAVSPEAAPPEPDAQETAALMETALPKGVSRYKDTAIPARGGSAPEKILRMKELARGSLSSERARVFTEQARFMADYEDNAPWNGTLTRYLPAYQDLRTDVLRGYFTWRTQLRKGNWQPFGASLPNIYLYELLAGVGASSPEDALAKMETFEREYLDTGYGPESMRDTLHQWMLTFCIVHNLPAETARRWFSRETLAKDQALIALRWAKDTPDEEVFRALDRISGRDLRSGPEVKARPKEAGAVYAAAWRAAARSYYAYRRRRLYDDCFGPVSSRYWFPFHNAVYYDPPDPSPAEYELNRIRKYVRRGGRWKEIGPAHQFRNRELLIGVLRETQRQLMALWDLGPVPEPRPEDSWAAGPVKAVLDALPKRNRLRLDLSGLDRIRLDALVTRDSLLTDEEMEDEEPEELSELEEVPDSAPMRMLDALLAGGDAEAIAREEGLMLSVAADAINEAMMEYIGDSVVDWDGTSLTLVEDYREDLLQIMKGVNE